ncbi:hypothetical protein [Spiroplasma ixodetis]|uniref:Uncharacterized protein n=1 Tax=Spiroplasma ixodetis TaxID=2141 RepID=A0ABM8JQ86_9MOLU
MKKTDKSKIYNKAIIIKGKVNLSSLTKKQEKIFNTKYNDHIFDDNSKKLFSRSIFLRKMFERQNQKKLKKNMQKFTI